MSERLIQYEDILDGGSVSYIDGLPSEINGVITSFLLGSDYSVGIMEASDILEVTSGTHDFFLHRNGLDFSQLPYSPVYYVSDRIDCQDVREVDDAVVYAASTMDRTVFCKRILCFWLLSLVPMAEGSPFLDASSIISEIVWYSRTLNCLTLEIISRHVLPVVNTDYISMIFWLFVTALLSLFLMKIASLLIYALFHWLSLVCNLTLRGLSSTLYKTKCICKKIFCSPRLQAAQAVIPARVLSIRETVSGKKYLFEANGLQYEGVMTQDSQELEMSQKGSYLTYSNNRPVGAIIAIDDEGNYTVVGGFFRIDDYLVTALHVAELIGSRAGKFEFAKFDKKIGKSVINTINTISVDKKKFDVAKNIIQEDMVDCFVVRMDKDFWSKAGVKTSKFAHSYYEQPVTSTGIRDGILVCATGLTQEHPEAWMLQHSATTEKGFSGFPIFHGKGVVGMHIIGGRKFNTCIRIELIVNLLPQKESDSPFPHSTNFISGKRNLDGRLEELGEYFGFDVGIDSTGRIQFRRGEKQITFNTGDPEEVYEKPIGNMDVYFDQRAEHGLGVTQTLEQKFLLADDIEDYGLPRTAPEPPRVVVPKQYGIRVLPMLARTRVPRIRQPNEKMTNYLNTQTTELQSLGFEDNKYSWPILTETAEETSIVKAMELTSERYKNTPDEMRTPSNRVRRLLAKMLESFAFVAPIDVKSPERLQDIMNSSYVKDTKSAGYPYCAEGMPNNESVFRHYGGVEGFTNIVLQKWDDPLVGRVFNKGEPTKQAKIDKNMLRTIYGFPLHKTIKNVSVFKEIADTAVERWCDSPVKYAYSPLIPRANHHLKEVLDKGGKIWSSDKPNYDSTPQEKDYTYFSWLVQDLARKHPDSTQEQFDNYKNQVAETCREVCHGSFVCSNGKQFKLIQGGQTRSGWFMTILFNSIGQLIKHIEICIKLGLRNKVILDSIIIVGGDDVVQLALEGVTKEEYIKAGEAIGCSFTIEETELKDGFEYFSHRIFPLGRNVASVPVRFTKHIMNLFRATPGCEGDSLISLMYEWIWDHEKYSYFYGIYMRFHIEDPDNYPLDLIPNPMVVQAHLNGEEVGTEVEKDLKRYGKLHRTLSERREMAVQCGVW